MLNSLYKGPSHDYTQDLTLNLGLNLTSINTNNGIFNFKAGVFLGTGRVDLLFGKSFIQ